MSAQIQSIPVYQAIIPREGPKAVRIDLDLDTGPHTVDLSEIIARVHMRDIQSVWIDAADSGQVTITPARGLPIVRAAGSQGWSPMIVAEPYTMEISGTGSVRILICNMPMPAIQWRIA